MPSPPSRLCNAIHTTPPIRRTRNMRFSTPGWIRGSIRPPAATLSARPAAFPGPATISGPRPLSRTIGGSPDSHSNLTICWRPTPCRRPKSCRIVWHQRRREIRGYRLIMPPCFRPGACRARPSKSLNEQRRSNPRIWSLKNSRLTSQWTFRSGARWIYWLMT